MNLIIFDREIIDFLEVSPNTLLHAIGQNLSHLVTREVSIITATLLQGKQDLISKKEGEEGLCR